MTNRIQKNEIAKRVALRLSINEQVAERYLDAVETLYEAFKSGENITLKQVFAIVYAVFTKDERIQEIRAWG